MKPSQLKSRSLRSSMLSLLQERTLLPTLPKWWFMPSRPNPKSKEKQENKLILLCRVRTTATRTSKNYSISTCYKNKQQDIMGQAPIYGKGRLVLITISMDCQLKKELGFWLWLLEIISPRNTLRILMNSDLNDGRASAIAFLLL